jgi:hypothetical protein
MPDRSRGVAFSIKLICIGTYGRVRPIEGCGLEEKKCCMQQKRCVSSLLHIALLALLFGNDKKKLQAIG